MSTSTSVCPLSGQKIVKSTSCEIADFINHCDDGIVYIKLKNRDQEFNDQETREFLNAISYTSNGLPVPIISDNTSFPGWSSEAMKVLIHEGMNLITNGAFIITTNGNGAGLKVLGAVEAIKAIMREDASRLHVYIKGEHAVEECRAFVLRNSKKKMVSLINEKMSEEDVKIFAGLIHNMNPEEITAKYGLTDIHQVEQRSNGIFEELGTSNMAAVYAAMKASRFHSLVEELLSF